MSGKSKVKLVPVFLSGLGVLLVGSVIYYLSSPANEAEASIALKHKDAAVVDLGRVVYAENCASCHGVALEGGKPTGGREMQMVICLRHRMMRQDTHGITLTHTSF